MEIPHGFFLTAPGNSTFFKTDLWLEEFQHAISLFLEISCPCSFHLAFFFFWNSPNPFSRNLIDTDGFQNCSKWITKTAKHFKWNTISDNIHDSETISSNFDEEIPLIKEKFMKTYYSLCFINTVVNEFQKG